MKRYTEYKDSGIESIGEIPKEWKVKKLNWIFTDINSGTTPNSSKTDYYDGDIPWLNTGDLNGGDIYETARFVNGRALKECPALKLFPTESIVIAMYGATIGKLGITKIEVCTNQACCVMARPQNCVIKYLYYIFLALRTHLISLSYGGGQPNISQGLIKSLRLCIPPIQTQQGIANYLDRKTAGVDTLIDDKQKLIDLLREKRQAAISEAVTKGIDKTVKMKDSGIDWIGEIPEAWKVSRMGYETWVRARLGWKGLKAEEYVDEGYAFLSTPNIKDREIDFENVNYISKERFDESPEIKLNIGDILLAKDGSTLGTINVVRRLPKETTVNSSIAVITPNESMSSIYLYYLLQSEYINNIIQMKKGGMGVPHLFQGDIVKF